MKDCDKPNMFEYKGTHVTANSYLDQWESSMSSPGLHPLTYIGKYQGQPSSLEA